VPSSEWKLKRTGERWYPGETISVAIGQGQLSVTPMSMAVMMATVANGGTRVVPRIVKAVDEGQGWKPVEPPPSPWQPFQLKPETISAVRDGLWLAVNGAGTAGRGRIAGRDVSGKTGTAQVISNEGKERARGKTDRNLNDHGWFVFMAPRDNPEVAGAIFVEHAEHGYYGATVAKHILETYFAYRDGLPLPEIKLPPAPVPLTPRPRVTATATATGGTH
jgi:penicillin-binding protein 2